MTDNEQNEIIQLYEPLLPQKRFHNSIKKFRLFWWAAGWWKSKWLRMEAITQCLSYEPRTVWWLLIWLSWLVLRRTYWELEGSIISKIREEIPKELYKYNASNHIMTFYNWSKITFWHCQYEKDVYKYQGEEFDFIWIDELTHFTEYMYTYLVNSRLRTTKPNVVANFFATTNPWWIWHTRVKRIWIDKDLNLEEKKDAQEYEFIPSRVQDNKYIMDNDPWYIKRLECLPDKEKKALLYWDRDIFDWQYFKEFSRDMHVISPIIPKFWRKIICMDYWYSAPSAVYWLNKSPNWQIICYRELYKNELTYKQLWLQILANTTEDELEEIEVVIVDPSIIWKRSETTGVTGWDELSKILPRRIRWWDNSRIEWWRVVRQWLLPYTDQNTKMSTSVLKICSNCVNLIRTLPWLVHDKVRIEDVDTTWEDHWPDALRYWLQHLWVEKRSLSELSKVNDKLIKEVDIPKDKMSFRKQTSTRDRKSNNILDKKF